MRSMRAASRSLPSWPRRLSAYSGNDSGDGRDSACTTRLCERIRGRRRAQARQIELLLEHLALGLPEQQVAGVVAAQHLVDRAGRGLQFARRLRLPRMALEHPPADARDLAQAARRQFAGVQAGERVGQQIVVGQRSRRAGRNASRQPMSVAVASSKP